MQRSSIQWTNFTSNALKYRYLDGTVVWACIHASPGCLHCYAEQLALRWHRGKLFNAANMREVVPFIDLDEITHIQRYKPAKGKMVFLCDMTDLFGDWVPDHLIDYIFAAILWRPDVTFQILTKRAQRMRDYSLGMMALEPRERAQRIGASMAKGGPLEEHCKNIPLENCGPVDWPPKNVWWGVSAENQKYWDERVPFLQQTPAQVRFVSYEPALGPIQLGESWCLCLDWVIVGGESGGKARPFQVSWATDMVAGCHAAGVPVFVKQMGSYVQWDGIQGGYLDGPSNVWPNPKTSAERGGGWRLHLKDRMGGTPDEWPESLRIRQFPVTV